MKKFLTSKIGNILLCIAEIIVGVLLLVNPDAVTSAFIIGAGAVMILTGIVFCTLYFVGEAEKMVIKQLLFKGLLLIILGVLCVTQYGVLLTCPQNRKPCSLLFAWLFSFFCCCCPLLPLRPLSHCRPPLQLQAL